MILRCVLIDLKIPLSNSLKNKRSIVKSIKKKIQNRFNISIAEVDHHDLWKKATLALSIVGNERVYVEKNLNAVFQFIETHYHDIEITKIKDYF